MSLCFTIKTQGLLQNVNTRHFTVMQMYSRRCFFAKRKDYKPHCGHKITIMYLTKVTFIHVQNVVPEKNEITLGLKADFFKDINTRRSFADLAVYVNDRMDP